MCAEFSIERLLPTEIDLFFEFRERVLPENPKRSDRDRWRWLYQHNPVVEEGLPVWVLKAQGNIVGTIAAIPCRVRVGQEFFTVYFGTDYYVDSAFSGLPALRLLKTLHSCAPLQVGANLSVSARKLFLKMGYTDLSTEFYIAATSLSYTDASYFRNILTKYLRMGAHYAASASSYKTEISAQLPDTYAKLWEKISFRRDSGIEKTVDYLRWRYEQCPTTEYSFVNCTHHGELCALAVVSILQGPAGQDSKGLIFDLLVPEGSNLALIAVVNACLKYFSEHCCMACQLHCNAHWARPLLRGLGFYFATSNLGLMIYVKKDAYQLKSMQQSAAWNISLGDTDRY